MTRNSNNDTPQAQETTQGTAQAVAQKAKPAEGEYSATDLAAAARKRFGVTPEIVAAALKMAGKRKATLAEAQQIVKDFKERKVK